MHWSEGGKNGKIRSHVDYISESVGQPKDNSCIWELEVKAKDKAILQLMKG
jgi:UV DNA damage repair endonuclease